MERKTRSRTVTLTRTLTQVQQSCPVCSRQFWGAPTRSYCSKACRNKADYARHAEQRRAARMARYSAQQKQ